MNRIETIFLLLLVTIIVLHISGPKGYQPKLKGYQPKRPPDFWQTEYEKDDKYHFRGYRDGEHSYFGHTRIGITAANVKLMNITLTTLLERVVRILNILDIRYTISAGTLLGWQRNQQFIPWDDDIDIRVHPSDWHKLHNIYKTANRSGTNWNIYKVKGIDILPVQSDGRLSILDKRSDIQFRVIGVGYTNLNHHNTISKDIHLDLVSADYKYGPWKNEEIAFEKELMSTVMNGVTVKVTQNYKQILQQAYGKNWSIPN